MTHKDRIHGPVQLYVRDHSNGSEHDVKQEVDCGVGGQQQVRYVIDGDHGPGPMGNHCTHAVLKL